MEFKDFSYIVRCISRGIFCISFIIWVKFARISVQAEFEVSHNSTVFLRITSNPLFLFSFGPLSKSLLDVYCREGSQGPCPQGNVFMNYGDSGPQFAYSYFGDYDDKDCFPKVSLPNNVTVLNQTGICIRADPEDPCQGYPATFKFLISSASCLTYDELTESCEENNQALYELNDTMACCDCRTETELYWPETDKCYKMNSQGPCDEGQWIVLDSDGYSMCEETMCLADGSHVYLKDRVDGILGCYELNSQGFCRSPGIVKRVQVHPELVLCKNEDDGIYSVANKVDIRKCPAGSKLHSDGHCKIIYKK